MENIVEGARVPATGARTGMTFILPVLNRRSLVVRAIRNCLACDSDLIAVHVLVVDGGSTDGTMELVAETFGGDRRVVTVRQPPERPGFQHAAWFAVQLVHTPLVTYMYSDDLVSPYFARLLEALAGAPDIPIVFGYGRQIPEDQLIQFEPIVSVDRIGVERILDAYYGDVGRLDGNSMPVSPVCCTVRTKYLKEWVAEAQGFVAGRPLRQHAMVKLAGGPDLMIYLFALLRGGGEALRADRVVGQLTVTSGSITETGNREAQLTVGYWLGRVWGFEEVLRMGRRDLAARCGGYLLAVWVYIMLTKLRMRDGSWTAELFDELKCLVGRLRAEGILLKSLTACAASIAARLGARRPAA